MPDRSLIQTAFSAGELSPSMYARVDLAKYHIGCSLARNYFVDYRGGLSNRTGTMFVGPCGDFTDSVRFIPFTFSTLQTYVLEFGNLYMYVIKDGAYVLEPSINITAITQANPCKITAANLYANGDRVYLTGIGGMTRLNGQFFTVANRAAGDFTLLDLFGNAVDSTGYTAYTAGGTAARVFRLATTYAAADLALLKYSQSADVMTLTHPGYITRLLTRTGHAAWTIVNASFTPTVLPPTACAAAPSTGGGTTYRYVVTAVGANGVQESIPSNVGTAASVTMSTTAASTVQVTWTPPVAAPSFYNVYRQLEVDGGAPDAGALYGFIGSTTTAAFVDQNILPDLGNTPPIAYNPFAGTVFPGCSTYYQGRQWFAAPTVAPQTIYGSKSADFLNMDYSNPSKADDAIQNTLISRQVNAVKHMVGLNALIALTASGAWKIDGGSTSDTITPDHFVANPQAFNGSSDVPPITINNDILYVQSKGSIVRDLSYNFYVNVYTGTDITVMANHLFTGKRITEWTWAEEPHKMIWALRNDGIALTLTYLKEQDVYGWGRHDTDGMFKSVCSVSEGQEDAVYFAVKRLINGRWVQYAERLASRNFQDDVTLAWFVDCALQYPLTRPAAAVSMMSGFTFTGLDVIGNLQWAGTGTVTASAAVFAAGDVGKMFRVNGGYGTVIAYIDTTHITVKAVHPFNNIWPAAQSDWSLTAPVLAISGLDHLEGSTVSILADGGVQAPRMVANGSITLDKAASSVFIGLPYQCQGRTLDLDVGEPTIQGKRKSISAVTMRQFDSRGLKVGPDFGHMREIKERSTEPLGTPITLKTGDERINIDSSWQVAGRVCWQQDYPLPSTVLGVIPEITVGDDVGAG